MLPVTATAAKLSPWLSSREVVAGVARHLGCTPEDAELRIVGKAKAGLIKANGVIEGLPVSPLPAAWHGTTDLVGTTMRPPPLDASSSGTSEITNLELCYIDLVAAGLLPAPAEKTRWSAAEAIGYLIKGVPLPWAAWHAAGIAWAEIEQAAKELARLIGEDRVPARGRLGSLQGPMEEIPDSDLSIAGFTWVIRPDGDLGTSPPGRLAVFQGRRWYGIEVDAAALRRARSRSADPKLAKAKSTRPQRDRVIRAIKSHYPPDGIRPKGVSIKALTERINRLSEFEDGDVSEDTVRLADIEIKAKIKAARKK